VYQVGINKGIILQCTAYQISRFILVVSVIVTDNSLFFICWQQLEMCPTVTILMA